MRRLSFSSFLLLALIPTRTILAQNTDLKTSVDVQVFHLQNNSLIGARMQAALSLGQKPWVIRGAQDAQEEASRINEAEKALSQSLRTDENVDIRMKCSWALANLNTDTARKELLRSLDDSSNDPLVLIASVSYLLPRLQEPEASFIQHVLMALEAGISHDFTNLGRVPLLRWRSLVKDAAKIDDPRVRILLRKFITEDLGESGLQTSIALALAKQNEPAAMRWLEEKIPLTESYYDFAVLTEILGHFHPTEQKRILLACIKKIAEPTDPAIDPAASHISIRKPKIVRDCMIRLTRLGDIEEAFEVFSRILSNEKSSHPNFMVSIRFFLRSQDPQGVSTLRDLADKNPHKMAEVLKPLLRNAPGTDALDQDGMEWFFSKLDPATKFELLRAVVVVN